ncbi:hypothetical protein F0344_28290 [Streptomyces finlayi]|uniref:Uncharacterized protein n=1 Tax=Streptomyces finlayi TaxID=67296 RepID=A0A7G7BRL1_9ACTN|nr:hypothetical protein [Streptomyces finlayi]QNE77976.1 hypothetical protein F0344_28290 [Streptomyces finlayi]
MSAPAPGSGQYDAPNGELQAQSGDTVAGCLSHVCVATGTGLEIYDLGESQEAMDRFGAAVMPVAQRMGLPQSPAPPASSPVHTYGGPGA